MSEKKEYTAAEILQRETDVLLEKSVKATFNVAVYPKWYEFWKKKKKKEQTFYIHPLKLAQHKRIQGRLAHLPESIFDGEQATMNLFRELINNHYSDIVYCIAVAMSEDVRNEPKKELLEWIEHSLDSEDMENLWKAIIIQSNVNPFLNGIILMKGINLSKMNPAT